MQRQSGHKDPAFPFILRQVEKRHTMFDCMAGRTKESAAQKVARSRADDIDWESCLQKYFDYLESWANERSCIPSDRQSTYSGRSRRSSLISEPDTYAMRRSTTMDSSVSYSTHRSIEETDTSRFYRKPRDRNSLRLNSLADLSRHSSFQSLRGDGSTSSGSSSTIVQQPALWKEAPIKSQSTPLPGPPPFIDNSPSSINTPWERLAMDINGTLIEDLTTKYPELRPAHRDIVWETRNMTATEARAYVQGRLAAIPMEAMNMIKDRLLTPPQRRHSVSATTSNSNFAQQTKKSQGRNHDEEKSRIFSVAGNIFSVRPNIAEAPNGRDKESRTQSLLLSSIRRITESPPNTAGSDKAKQDPLEKLREQERKKREKRKTISMMQVPTPVNAPGTQPPSPGAIQKAQPRAISSLKSSQSKAKTKAKKSRIATLKLSDIRPLTAISERSFSAKSWKSSKSWATKPDVPELPSIAGLAIPATRARVSVTSLELVVELASPHQAEPLQSDKSDRNKELPPIPDSEKAVQLPPWLMHPTPLGSHPVGRPKSRLSLTMESAIAPRTFDIERLARHNSTRMSLPSTVKTGRQAAVAREALHKKESKLRVMALQDSLDKELGAWLQALPYIEGRAGTPNSKRNSWKGR